MNAREAKEILLLYRRETEDVADSRLEEALALVRQDSELGRWFEEHLAFQQTVREKLRAIPAPAELRERLLAERKVVRPPAWWQRAPVWAAAAAVALLIGLTIWWSQPRVPDQFADFRSRMVRSAVREYQRMDIVTNNMAPVRRYMAQRGAPADYVVPPGLDRLQLTGAKLVRWRNHPVSMVCFDRGDKEMLFLFVLERDTVADAPNLKPIMDKVKKYMTASWSEGDNTYLLAGPDEPGFVHKYL